RALAAMTARNSLLSRWKRVADIWCASWFAGDDVPARAFGALSDVTLTGAGALSARSVEQYLDAARTVAESRRFFHWELEFPEVFFAEEGLRLPQAGFDAVIGNPPWDMIRADAGSHDARSQARTGIAAVLRFTRQSGIY